MKIRTRILLAFVLFIFVGVFGLVYWIEDEIRPQYLEAQEETLVDLAEMMATLVSEQGVRVDRGEVSVDPALLNTLFDALPKRDLSAQVYALHKTRVDLRIYLTDQNGRVIFDSDHQRDLGADYSNWRDVQLTLRGEYGARATRGDPIFPSGTTLYITRPILYQGDVIGALSVGKPTENANRFIEQNRQKLLLSAAVITLAVTLIGLLLNLWFTRPLQQLQRYAQAVSRGERRSLPMLGDNEVGEVGEALESMRRALDGKSYVADYVQSLTHELKSPIAGIRGAAELLQEPIAPEHQQRFLNNIVDQTERMQSLIERLLDLAELEYRPALEHPEQVELASMINQVIESESDYAQSHGVELRAVTDDSVSCQGDPFLIQQALINLVKNAIEYSPRGGEVRISIQREGEGCQLSVCDQGPGIPTYAVNRILERFYSLPKPNGRKGTGLGLSFVKEIMALHGGSIDFDSEPSRGTCARLHFKQVPVVSD